MRFGEKLLVVAKDRQRDLTDIAREAGIPYGTLRNYTKPRSERLPSAPTGIAIAKALGVSIEWLFDHTQAMPAPSYQEPPPFAIRPWPPEGITWKEVDLALNLYVQQRTRKYMEEASAQLAEEDVELGNGGKQDRKRSLK